MYYNTLTVFRFWIFDEMRQKDVNRFRQRFHKVQPKKYMVYKNIIILCLKPKSNL